MSDRQKVLADLATLGEELFTKPALAGDDFAITSLLEEIETLRRHYKADADWHDSMAEECKGYMYDFHATKSMVLHDTAAKLQAILDRWNWLLKPQEEENT